MCVIQVALKQKCSGKYFALARQVDGVAFRGVTFDLADDPMATLWTAQKAGDMWMFQSEGLWLHASRERHTDDSWSISLLPFENSKFLLIPWTGMSAEHFNAFYFMRFFSRKWLWKFRSTHFSKIVMQLRTILNYRLSSPITHFSSGHWLRTILFDRILSKGCELLYGTSKKTHNMFLFRNTTKH